MALNPRKLDVSDLKPSSAYKLASGYTMPAFGFGVYQTPAADTERLTSHALQTGYRLIDSAVVYRNERGCATAIRGSHIPRDEIFYVSKVPPKRLSRASALSAVASTFEETGLEYVDLYLLHSPYGGTEARLGAWDALVEMQKQGKIRSLGVSNFGIHHMEELEKHIASVDELHGKGAGGTVSVNQVEIHPWLPRTELRRWCAGRGIVVQAYSPLARGQRMDDSVLNKVAKRLDKTPAQVLLRWSLQSGVIPTVKSVDDSEGGRIEKNWEVWDWQLNEQDMKLLSGDGEDKERYSPSAWDPTVEQLTE